MKVKKEVSFEKILQTDNVATLFSESDLRRTAQGVIQGYEDDLSSRAQWDERSDKYTKLALQVAETKSFPWDGASNVKFPLLTISAIQFAARAYPAFIRGNSVARYMVVGKDPDGKKAERASRVSQHMNYQLMYQMEEWEPDMDRLLHIVPVLGCAFKKTYRVGSLGVNRSELILPKDLVVDYWTKTLSDAYRVTHNAWMRPNTYVEGVRAGIYLDIGSLGDATRIDDQINSSSRKGEETEPLQDEGALHLFLEQHTFLDLDGDGYEEPYIVTVHKGTESVVSIEKRFFGDEVFFNGKREIAKIIPEEYFTKYGFIPALDGGFYDTGFGALLSPVNEAVDTLINQLIDSGTLANLGGGFIGRGIRTRGGKYRFTPGEWKFIDASGEDLRKNIVPIPQKDPSSTLFNLLGILISSGEKLASITDPMTGQSPGSHTTASATANLIEQGMKVFSGVVKRLHRSLHSELRKIYRLNGLYLTEEEYVDIVGGKESQLDGPGEVLPGSDGSMGESARPPQPPVSGVIVGDDYSGSSLHVIPFSDPSIINESQVIQKLQTLFPFIADPDFQGKKIKRAFVDALGIPNSHEFLSPDGTKPPPDPEQLKVVAELEIEKEKVQLHRFEAEARAIKSRIEAIEIAARTEMDVPEEAYSEGVAKYAQVMTEVKGNGQGGERTSTGMVQKQGNGPVPRGSAEPQG